MTQIDILPKRLALYLTIAQKQRQRARDAAAKMYGENSAAVAELDQDLSELQIAITNMIKTAAEAPLTAVTADKTKK